jgi:hypothetical protein
VLTRVEYSVPAKASAVRWKRLMADKVSQRFILVCPLFVKPTGILNHLFHAVTLYANVYL